MTETIKETLNTPVLGNYDVIVCGGGIGGLSAAVSAKRAGANVLIIEKSIILGGLATNGLISWYEPLCDGYGRKRMYGIVDELFQLAIRYGSDTLPEEWRSNPDSAETKKRFATYYSPTIFTIAIDRWLKDEGIKILLDTAVVNAVMRGNRCEGVVVENKSGRGYYKSKAVIDATGDSDIMHRIGVPCTEGKNYLTYIAYLTNIDKLKKSVDHNDILKSRDWLNVGADLWGKGHPEGMPYFETVSAEEITRFVLKGREVLFERIKNDVKRERDITVLPGMPQFRMTRRIEGEYTLREEDEGKSFDDSIGVAADFYNRGKGYELPLRILYSTKADNVLTVGRSVSSSGWAWEVTRVIPVAAVTGQAAGIAGASCARENVAINNLDVKEIQQELIKSSVKLKL